MEDTFQFFTSQVRRVSRKLRNRIYCPVKLRIPRLEANEEQSFTESIRDEAGSHLLTRCRSAVTTVWEGQTVWRGNLSGVALSCHSPTLFKSMKFSHQILSMGTMWILEAPISWCSLQCSLLGGKHIHSFMQQILLIFPKVRLSASISALMALLQYAHKKRRPALETFLEPLKDSGYLILRTRAGHLLGITLQSVQG